jgi:D-alanine transaminase
MLLDILRQDGSIPVEERIVSKQEVLNADEVWITSSTKEIGAVIEVDGSLIGDGKVGDVWLAAQRLFSAHKFNY